MIDHRFGEIVSVLFQEIGNIVFADVGTGEEKLLVLMFLDDLEKVFSVFKTCKDLTLPDDDIFLKVIRSLIRDTEVFHIGRHLDLKFLADVKEMIDSMTTCEDDRSMLEDVYFLFAKLFYRNWLNLDEWSEIYFEVKLLSKFQIWRVEIGRCFLCDQDALHFAHPVIGSLWHIYALNR